MKRLFEFTGYTLIVVVILLILYWFIFIPFDNNAPSTPGLIGTNRRDNLSFVLDGVEVNLSSPFIKNKSVIISDPTDPIQTAAFIQRSPAWKELTVTAFPLGTVPSTEIFSAADTISLENIRNTLSEHRRTQDENTQPGPTAFIFEQEAPSHISKIDIFINVDEPTTVQIIEWVVEAGDRIWLLRKSEDLGAETNQTGQSQDELTDFPEVDIVLTSSKLDAESQILQNIQPKDILETEPKIPADLPSPDWWDGECDTNNYHSQTGVWSYPLGGSHRGVQACGPRPWYDDVQDVLVRFYPGAWGHYEFQCVELCMRFMYLAYEIEPYQASGNEVVPHYSGDLLIKVNNGTEGYPPLPNDIISAGSTTTYGHSTIVMESNVDEQGNGSITVLEQNSSANGIRTYTVTNWTVQSSTTVIGWLHDPTGDGPIDPPPFNFIEKIIALIQEILEFIKNLFSK